jgi:nicotinamide-nucleotide amidase
MREKPRISILLTGDELVNGDIVDTNSIKISKELISLGLEIEQKRVVGDQLERIIEAILELSTESQFLFVSGGLGSTVDDLGAEAAAKASGRVLSLNQQAVRHIDQICHRAGKKANKLHYRQALIPEGADILANPIGSAVGFKFALKNCYCYFMPGVPAEMEAMLLESVIPDILRQIPNRGEFRVEKLLTLGLGEVQIQNKIYAHFEPALWKQIKLGFRAFSPYTEIKLSCYRSSDQSVLADTFEQLKELFSDFCFSHGADICKVLMELLLKRKESISLAESCTGGLIAAKITAMAGASKIFQAGVVSYSNQAKEELLGVSGDLIQKFGAVSKEVAEAMVSNVIKKTKSDYGVAVTGIAGPGGGSQDKPVGTVFIGFGSREEIVIRELLIKRERTVFQRFVTATALDLLRRFILALPTDTPYYFDLLAKK